MDKAEAAAKAAKEVLPLVSQYGLAAALLIVSALFFAVVWFMGRHLVKLSAELSSMVKVNEVQATVQSGQAKQLDKLTAVLVVLSVIADRMKIQLPPGTSGEKG